MANLTRIHLLNVPFESDYQHTLYFGSKSTQNSYFQGKIVKTFEDCSYQRKDNVIRVPAHFDNLYGCNYVMYQNNAYSDKWFYCFIESLEYINDQRTDIHVKTDVIQTWMFDYAVKTSFVEREHVNDDTVGKHTVPEQLETGEYIINAKNKNTSLLNHSLIIATTVDLNTSDLRGVGGGAYNGIYSGVKYFKVDHIQANEIISHLAEEGKSDAIVSIFVCPAIFVDATVPSGGTYAEVKNGLEVIRKDWVNTFGVEDTENYKPTKLNGYTPKNKKLLTYPYTYMLLSNNAGGSAVYHYEYFNNPDDPSHCAFYIYATITPGFSICISPRYYKGVDINSNERLNSGKYPICNWNTDVYTNWLTQNAVNIPISIGSSLLTVAGGIGLAATGGGAMAGASMIASGVLGVAGSVGEIYQHSLQPPQAEGNVNSGDVAFSSGILTFTAYQMTIKKEFAEIIDKYFDLYGYKVNLLKVPNKNHRENYWYTKTIDANITGAIPMEDMQQIKDCYNKGITFWKNPANIKNYSVSNAIV